MEYYFQDQLRWSYGFDNPNMAAALITSLLPLLWIIAGGFYRFGNPVLKWGGVFVGLALLCTGWWLLFKTYSRGGIVAGGAAFVYIAFCYRRALLREWRMVLVCVVVVAGLFVYTHAAQRSVGWIGNHEGSVENRFPLWKGGLEMLAENPQGVGRGKSGGAYMQWYQPLDMTARYRTLVNSYLTFATEQGIWIFGAMVFLAVAVWRAPGSQKDEGFLRDVVSGARASLLAFAVAGFFSTTMEEAKLWVVPAVCAVALIIVALCRREWRNWPVSFAQAAVVTLAVCGGLYASGLLLARAEPVRVALRNGPEESVVIVPQNANGKDTRLLRVILDENVTGTDYGKLLRHLSEVSHQRVSVSNSTDFNQGGAVILAAGESVNRLMDLKDKEVILLAPAKMEDVEAAKILHNAKSVKLLLPGFDEDGRVAFWRDAVENAKRPDAITIQTLPGVGTETEWAWDVVIQECSSGG